MGASRTESVHLREWLFTLVKRDENAVAGIVASFVLMITIVAAATAAWTIAIRRLRLAWQVLITLALLLLSWAWEANTALVLQRATPRYCKILPLWPPFSGPPVDVPQWLMVGMSFV